MADEKPLTDEVLAEIRQGVEDTQARMRAYTPRQVHDASQFNPVSHFDRIVADTYAFKVVPELLVEVERLRAFVRDVLAIDADTDDDGEYYYVSPTDFGAVIDKASALAASWEQ